VRKLARYLKYTRDWNSPLFLWFFKFHIDNSTLIITNNEMDMNVFSVPVTTTPLEAYEEAFRLLERSFRFLYREGNYELVPLDPGKDVTPHDLIRFGEEITAKNILSTTVFPTFEWSPSVSDPPPVHPYILRAFLVGNLMACDQNVETPFSMTYKCYRHAIRKRIRENVDPYAAFEPQNTNITTPRPLSYLAGRAYFKANPDLDPLHYARNSFVSGGTRKGFMAAVNKMRRNDQTTRADVSHIATAILSVATKHKSHIVPIPYPITSIDAQNSIHASGSTSGGVTLNAATHIDHVAKVEFVTRTTKTEGETATRLRAIMLIDTIKRGIEKGVDYDPSWFDDVDFKHMMSIKQEARPPNADPDKTRVIFVVSQLKTFLDRMTLGPFMKRNYGIGANAIGTIWQHGGAHKFAKRAKVFKCDSDFFRDNPLAYLSLDIQNFDQSVLAGLLLVVCLMPMIHTGDNDLDSKVIKALIRYCTSSSVVKCVKWFGKDWKMIIGMMFSGEYITSYGDSIYLEILMECFDIYVYAKLKKSDPEFAEYWSTHARTLRDYGDDIFSGRDPKCMRYICRGTKMPVLLIRYLKKYWFMTVKTVGGDTYVCFPDDPRPDMAIPCFFTQIDSVGNMKYRGPKFLKRYFLWDSDKKVVNAWRPTEDYYTKMVAVAGQYEGGPKNQSIALHLIRLRALAVDTMATNPQAYGIISAVYNELERSSPLHVRVADQLLMDAEYGVGGGYGSLIDKGLRYSVEQDPDLVSKFPSLRDIAKRNIDNGFHDRYDQYNRSKHWLTGHAIVHENSFSG